MTRAEKILEINKRKLGYTTGGVLGATGLGINRLSSFAKSHADKVKKTKKSDIEQLRQRAHELTKRGKVVAQHVKDLKQHIKDVATNRAQSIMQRHGIEI